MRKYFGFIAIAVLMALVGCENSGGERLGSDVAPPAPPPAEPTAFTAVAMAGELLTYSLDTTKLTYSYIITESMYGLDGKGGSGSLTLNSDGSYSPSGIPNAKVAMLPNGLLLGAIRESINGELATIPVIGMSTPVTSLADGAGTYNFVQRSCLNKICSSAFGTFRIGADATWASCPRGDLAAPTGCAVTTNSGTLNSLGGGRWQVLDGATNIGTAIAFKSGGQNVVVLDLKDTRAGGFGLGVLVGSSRQAIDTSTTDGTWITAATNGEWATLIASGTQVAYQTINGAPSTKTVTLEFDRPWSGFGTSSSGGNGILAGIGVYAYQNDGGYAEIGVKIK